MHTLRHYLRLFSTTFITLLLAGIALAYGPVAQLTNYHDFADQHTLFGIAHGADVLSNLGFALVALWGWRRLAPARKHPGIAAGWAGYALFLAGLLLTAFGSTWYHLDPDNARLVWDRLPITLACGGLLAGVWGDARQRSSAALAAGLALAGMASVAWWYFTELAGSGDLRAYLLLQILPILLIPLLQWIHGTPPAERWAFAGALLLYVFAKFAEMNDHQIAAVLGALTGHTLKHLLATAAAALVVASLVQRVRAPLEHNKPVASTSGQFQ
ncbi:hypothetical protein [Janthinobacterium sp. 17J80-10]|uniref:hypothetical protein n=1 Tax=Janthinobacterium sp. 17J80-10 TaxID=2497863 RepID=UPI00100576FE|nr:hypothetical protein [Janthinobacterium sp. 17J80-10]QAU33027.1 hypothetical protein EKL02_01910 [Janthinobacterium sp. 17J80-10]